MKFDLHNLMAFEKEFNENTQSAKYYGQEFVRVFGNIFSDSSLAEEPSDDFARKYVWSQLPK